MENLKINLWSSPRNISTALMYSFAQRPDTTVVDEPLYAYYLSNSPVSKAHPGKEEIIQSMDSDGKQVVETLLKSSGKLPITVYKQMTHHLLPGLDREFMVNMKNVLLIRDPAEIIASFHRVIPHPAMEDVGVKQQFELFRWLKSKRCLTAIVDTNELLKDPEGVLKQLCTAIGIAFHKQMLSWPPGPRKEDGIWAKYWYHSVHSSSGFRPYRPKEVTLPESLLGLSEKCRPYYQELYRSAIRARGS